MDTINKIIGKETNQKVKSIKINFEGESVLVSSVKQTYVEFIKKICANEDDFLKLKSKGWIFSKSDYDSSKDDYAEIGRPEAYIYTNCNIDLLIVKMIKAVIDIGKEHVLDDSTLSIEFSGDLKTQASDTQISEENKKTEMQNNKATGAVNKIYYGIPGCGKSYKVQAMLDYEDDFQEDANLLGIFKK